MKSCFLLAVCVVLTFASPIFAQQTPVTQEQDVKIPISVVSGNDTTSFGRLLATRLQQAVSKTGMSEYESYNFVLFPKINILSQDLTSSAPTLTVVNLEMTLIVANGYQSKSIIFNSETFSLKGVGKSQERAMLEAARSLRADNPRLQAFIDKSRQAIVRYFAANCEAIISEAQLMGRQALLAINKGPINDKAITAETQFSWAIGLLYNIRSANYSCYQSSIEKINQILNQYDDFSCQLYLGRARNHWAAREVDKTVAYLNKIPPSQKCRAGVDELLRQMDGYQERMTDKDLKEEVRVLREREKAGKDMLELVMDGQKKETSDMRDARRQETIINVLGPPTPPNRN
ncbi:hypothetical protein [Persicitalea jodogahamensis]|uniref:Uncharacterized protein n=1 Tax=Persicitalea jodogahamensis TaxID=402147 RepID=A0A8J3GBS0_9BACT|nr:hypothetical protein [Persicitalea jodogahamensis]GHB88909.1 hypothetical protein GCM10007390_51280 [Persicitalea jodogahamensis]